MKRTNLSMIAACIVALGGVLAFQITPRADITESSPGYPGTWEGLTTNTTIEIVLDSPVGMVDPLTPDITYCVQKAELSGLDIVLADVACTVDVSGDRKTITLYPNDVLGENGMYAYKVENINFEDASSEQGLPEYFETGDNPIPAFALAVNEADMCGDEGANLSHVNPVTPNFWCVRCHASWADEYPTIFGVCVLSPYPE